MVPVGGAHVTSDIAQGLGTTFAAAENLKIAHGLTDAAQLDGPEPLEIGRLGDDGRLRPAILDRSALAGIIRPRIEETFELVAECLHSSAVRYSLPHRVVLTGGASALPGVKEIAQAVLGAPVRLSKPLLAEFMGQSLATPEFATASGLLLAKARGLAQPAHVLSVSPNAPGGSGEGLSQSFFSWLKDNF
jgi:cell division protein FtsA